MPTNNENIIEVPYTEVEAEKIEEVAVNPNDFLNLEDVHYMVMIGRDKDGKTFLRTANINDLILIKGLIGYAEDKVSDEIRKREAGE